jgi:hypothetical protein
MKDHYVRIDEITFLMLKEIMNKSRDSRIRNDEKYCLIKLIQAEFEKLK